MIYLDLLIGFLKVGLFAFGGAYGAIPLIRDVKTFSLYFSSFIIIYLHHLFYGAFRLHRL